MLGALLTLVVYLIVLGLLYWLFTYLVSIFPLPDPAGRIANAIIVVIIVFVLIFLLLDILGAGNYGFPRFNIPAARP